jgi:hypothetical protein
VVLAEIILVTPILMLIVATIVQMMFIMNTTVVLRYAALQAARAGVVRFERDGARVDEFIDPDADWSMTEAAVVVMSTVTSAFGELGRITAAGTGGTRDPGGGGQSGGEGGAGSNDPVAFGLHLVLVTLEPPLRSRTAVERVKFARVLTSVDYESRLPDVPARFLRSNQPAPHELEVTVHYDMVMSLAGLAFLPTLTEPLPGDPDTRVFPMSATVVMQGAGSRVHSPGASVGPMPSP